jgi:hypothetical protein
VIRKEVRNVWRTPRQACWRSPGVEGVQRFAKQDESFERWLAKTESMAKRQQLWLQDSSPSRSVSARRESCALAGESFIGHGWEIQRMLCQSNP